MAKSAEEDALSVKEVTMATQPHMALTLSTHLWVPVFGENVSIMGGREGKKERGKQSTLSAPANLPGTLHMILTKLLLH